MDKADQTERAQLQPVVKNRVTVVETVYFQEHGMEPRSVESKFCHNLESSEQWYERVLKVGETPMPIELPPWINPDEVSWLLVANLEGKSLSRIPSEEESRRIAARVVELRPNASEFAMRVNPGMSLRIAPRGISVLSMQCLSETARIRIVVIPK